MKRNVFVVGGAGYIGSHVTKMLDMCGYHPIVLDNLSTGSRKAVTRGTFIEGDMADKNLLDTIFQSYPISAVMHFAAFINVGESVQDPMKYYHNNVCNTLSLLQAMIKNKVNIFIFSSTAAIFGCPQEKSIHEEHPCNPINPYGRSKLMVEEMLRDFSAAYGLKSCSLRYFNAAGGDPEGEIKNYKIKESNLIPIILRSIKFGDGSATIYGTDYPTPDGTCIRDYIHIVDLAKAHITAMEQLFQGAPTSCYNLGNGKGYSVKEVILTAEKTIGKKLRIHEGPRRAGDPPVLLANGSKAREKLGWVPEYSPLDFMIRHAWEALP